MIEQQLKINDNINELYNLTEQIKIYNMLLEKGWEPDYSKMKILFDRFQDSMTSTIKAFDEYFKLEKESKVPTNLHYRSLYKKLTES